MVKQIVGGIITVVIGGSIYSINQTDVVKNFSKNSGLSQQQAQSYVNNIPTKDLASFSEIGKSYINEANQIPLSSIDCGNATYAWMSDSLSCYDGLNQMQTFVNDETKLGNCLIALNTNLNNEVTSKIKECISDIDALDSDYNLPVMQVLISSTNNSSGINESKKTDQYNKSVLESALQSKGN